jgi:thioredoxin reductase (NADPH)
MSTRRFDVVVVGAGPAGLEAAAVVAEAGLTCAAIDRMGPGGQLMNLGAVSGVAGLEPGATGPDLLGQLVDRTMTAGAEIAIDDVSSIAREGADFVIEALDGRYEASAVIIATGLTPGTTGLADEQRFEGAGLSHCAHCDAPLYAGQPVAVAGGDAWAVEEALELSEHASQVTLVVDGGPPAAAADRLAQLKSRGNVAIIEGRITALTGSDALDGIRVSSATGESQIAARGLFLQTGRVPALRILGPGVSKDEGLFIAGDAREGSGRTIAGAIADGARAGQNAVAWVKAGQARERR